MEKSLAETRDLGLIFSRLIAGMAVDPHGYFEKKYVIRIESSQSANEINLLLAQLVQWVGSSDVSDQEREYLDRELGKRDLPSIDYMRQQYLP